jgi:hypothetical protein
MLLMDTLELGAGVWNSHGDHPACCQDCVGWRFLDIFLFFAGSELQALVMVQDKWIQVDHKKYSIAILQEL